MPAALQLLGHEKDLGGGFKVRRLLPARASAASGPSCSSTTSARRGAAGRQPRRAAASAHRAGHGDYLFEGAMMHRDSLGTTQRIEPGAINWMTSGRGIVHSERKPDHLRASALSSTTACSCGWRCRWRRKRRALVLAHAGRCAFPSAGRRRAGARAGGRCVRRALAGARPRPRCTWTSRCRAAARIRPAGRSRRSELAVYPIAGEFTLDGVAAPAHQMLVLQPGITSRIQATGPARFVVVGGEPVGPRYMYWNFVSSSKDRILQASADWEAGATDFASSLPDVPRRQRVHPEHEARRNAPGSSKYFRMPPEPSCSPAAHDQRGLLAADAAGAEAHHGLALQVGAMLLQAPGSR
jgi:hypothetical protein